MHVDMPRVLDSVLGSGARVRVVRFLSTETERASSVSEIARGTGLTKQGALKALTQLVAEGIVIRSGSGRSNVYAFRSDSPLLEPLRLLFEREATMAASVITDLKQALAGVSSIDSAWVSRWPDDPTGPIEVHLLARPSALSQARLDTREALLSVESSHDRVIEILVHTRAELDDLDMAGLTMLAGIPMGAAVRRRPASPKGERATSTMKAVAQLVLEEPSLRGRAKRHLNTLLHQDQGMAQSDLREWQQILEAYSDQRLAEFLRSGSSRALRLYQSMPFLAVLTPDERDRILDAVEGAR